jgi:hypothetical protein
LPHFGPPQVCFVAAIAPPLPCSPRQPGPSRPAHSVSPNPGQQSREKITWLKETYNYLPAFGFQGCLPPPGAGCPPRLASQASASLKPTPRHRFTNSNLFPPTPHP